MKIAYLIDREALGGGCEYIRRQGAADAARGDTWKAFYADRGECRARTVDAWGADLVVVNHLRALLQLLGRPWERPRAPVRFVVHGLHLRKYDWLLRECPAARPLRRVRLCVQRRLRRWLEAWLYHRCAEIVTLTETDRRDVLRLYGDDLAVRVEPNTLEDWKPAVSADPPPGVRGPFAYVCIGRFVYQKGQDLWIRRLAATGDPGRTLFIGDGPDLAACVRLARRLGVADRCVFAGEIAGASRFLKCADAVVCPSRWEGMPYLVMKARALGCRILATDCPGNRDVLAGYAAWQVMSVP